jgi:RNA polymerase sigma-70 factor (sigma-E family)
MPPILKASRSVAAGSYSGREAPVKWLLRCYELAADRRRWNHLASKRGYGRLMSDFDAFAARHVSDLLRSAYLIVGDGGEAEDLVQECLIKIAARWPRVRRMEKPLAYTRRILVNLATDGARERSRRRGELDPSHGRDVVVEPLSGLEDRADLVAALAALPVRQRAMLVLRFFDDLTEAQTAEVIGCPVGTVKSTVARGLARLRASLEPPTIELGAERHE